jgi:DNA-binding NarL/FixJ family response regulator
VRVVIAEDLALLREGIASLLQANGFDVVGTAANPDELLNLVRAHTPELAVVDIRLPPSFTDEGLRATAQIRASHPETAVLVLSQYVDPEFAIELLTEDGDNPTGIGYLLKERVASGREFIDAMRSVVRGEVVIDATVVSRLLGRRRQQTPLDRLTEREREVLGLMAEGRSNAALADALSMSLKTVETHVRSIFAKLALDSSPNDHRRVLAVLAYLRS